MLVDKFVSTNMPTRVQIEPSIENGLSKTSWVMTDKITTVPKEMLHKKIGSLRTEELHAINRQLAIVLGLQSNEFR